MKKIVQRFFTKIHPQTGKILFSCAEMKDSQVMYVANYEGTQEELAFDWDLKQKEEKEINSNDLI